jgi:hypothetical protein
MCRHDNRPLRDAIAKFLWTLHVIGKKDLGSLGLMLRLPVLP